MTLHHLRRFVALSAGDRGLLLRAFLALIHIDVRLRVHGFRQVVEQNHQASRPMALAGPEQWTRALRYAHWLGVASRHHLVRARCLHRSLALHRWLSQEGITGQLRIGVRKRSDELEAHAWVELDGQLVSERPEDVAGFTPLTDADGKLATWVSGTADGSGRRRAVLLDAGGVQWQ